MFSSAYEIKDVEFKYYVEKSNKSCIFSKIAAKMAAENSNLMYLSCALRYEDKWSVDSYEIKGVELKYVENNNNKCIFSRMAAKMASENLKQMYLSFFSIDNNKWKCPVIVCERRKVYACRNT